MAVHTGPGSNVFHNDDFDDAHLNSGTLRHVTTCRVHLSLTIIATAAVCRRYVMRQRVGESMRPPPSPLPSPSASIWNSRLAIAGKAELLLPTPAAAGVAVQRVVFAARTAALRG